MHWNETKRLDAFSVRKGNFLKYKNQYFFYKKKDALKQPSNRSVLKGEKYLKIKKPSHYRDGFWKKLQIIIMD